MKKTALVTGGSRGIGYGVALALAKEGWNLVINGMRPEEGVSEPLESLRAEGVEVAYARGDIGSAEGRTAILEVARKAAGGSLNLLVNNAGVAPKQRLDILETTEESYDFVVDTNLKGAFFLTQAVANDMVAAKEKDEAFSGSIVNVSSISATVISVNRGEYCIAKAGLSMVTSLFAARLGEFGIPVYEVRPGVTKTDMTSGVTEKYDKLIEDGLCVTKRWGFPDDIGKAVSSLARGDFPYSTGQVIMIDGGLTLPRL
ncbi:3-ketoacyl-ACP reductase [Pelagicoccus sp. SDUM812002]|uniref:3-ketoacyl-ACP reductase n=1 Tax=Pelagicoccus sp. SDUM812002 TaxID=3041266 RepID=UPI0028103774|nr:3-ketoacyl-ACP reductase [Pelagicoccus sp. SDUM812002]MDQ8188319.1 3-ketoacyl-ACP reductase [Pelagicoccus sp. SDUM812002]